jgi:arylmalonate decarboxylase
MESNLKPRFVAGVVMPHEIAELSARPEPLLPPDVQRICSSIQISDYTHDGVHEAIDKHYWRCVDELMKQGAGSICLAGFPIASQLGRDRVLELQEKTKAKTGVTADSHAEATIAALKRFGATRIGVASRWADALNTKLVAYLKHAGIEVQAITNADQWAGKAFSMSIEEGVRLAFQLGREARKRAPESQAILLAGGAWRSLAAVPILEEDFGVPVVTNPIAEIWRIIDAGHAPPVKGWGRLLANELPRA